MPSNPLKPTKAKRRAWHGQRPGQLSSQFSRIKSARSPEEMCATSVEFASYRRIHYAHNALGQRAFKPEPLYPPSQGDENSPGFLQSLINFFTQLWHPATASAEQLGYAYIHDENGSLIGEHEIKGQVFQHHITEDTPPNDL